MRGCRGEMQSGYKKGKKGREAAYREKLKKGRRRIPEPSKGRKILVERYR